jgi:hypothetical protein
MKTRIILQFILASFLVLGAFAATPAVPVRADTKIVSNTNDSGAGSLRQAIADATDGDTIDASGISGTITLASELSINKIISIIGPGSGELTLSGNNDVRVVSISTGKTVSISGMTITNGRLESGEGTGAGILNFGDLILYDVIVSNNTIDTTQVDSTQRGGGISSENNSSLTVTNSTISGNSAPFLGGGLSVGQNATLNLDSVTIDNNHVTQNDSAGGGIYMSTGVIALLVDITISNNSAYLGGGMRSYSPFLMYNSLIANNFTTGGFGGGMYITGTQPYTLINVTVSGNSANSADDAVPLAQGGGINNFASTLDLRNVTITNNTAKGVGGGLTGANVQIENSILAGNTSTLTTSEDCAGSLNSSGYNLIQVTSGCTINGTTTGNILNQNPLLNPLADNGGPTMTHSLQAASPALDAGRNDTCPGIDQRWISRPQDGNGDTVKVCDMGAFEHAVFPTVLSITRADANPTAAASVDFTVTFSTSVTFTVDPSDFALVTSGVSGAAISEVNGMDATYTVTVSTGSGNGTIRLDLLDDDSIKDWDNNPLGGIGSGDGDFTSGEVYTVEKTPTFADVPFNGFAWEYIERLYNAGITGGCTTTPLNYCPNNSVNRAQMAIFLLRGIHGSAYTPPAATGTVFGDVPSTAFGAAWIEQLAAEGITGGCGGGNYCPNNTVTRSQMAIFLLRAKYGSAHTPPAATGTVFADIPSNAFAASWIEQLAGEGITGGCGGGNYCPDNPVTRAQMAIFLVRTFNLP